MIPLADAIALSMTTFSRRRVAEALRTWFPLEPDTLAAAGPPAVHAEGSTVELMFDWIAGPIQGPVALARARGAVGDAIERAERGGITPVRWGDSAYPPLVAAVGDAPPVLWVRGHVDALAGPAVAVVGSRAASSYGLEIAERLADGLARRGFAVVSGLARGADGVAHRGALAVDGVTVGVLGSGPDFIYPPEHRGLAQDVMKRGAIVSELPPGTPPRPFYFPMRNRIISGLSLGVVVIEAAELSGSLITAHMALDQGREVMVVPGSALNGRNRGGHALIKDGAALVEHADDVMEALGYAVRTVGRPDGGQPESEAVLRQMARGEAYDADALAALTGLDLTRLLPRLLELELEGAVRRDNVGRFVRAGRSC